MRKTTLKEEVKTDVKKEFNLKEAFALWRNESKQGKYYLSGYTLDDAGNKVKLLGYFNSDKENPKQPDVSVFLVDAEGKRADKVASLWENVNEKGVRYLTGTTDENEKLVAFYGKEHEELRPFIRAYYKEN